MSMALRVVPGFEEDGLRDLELVELLSDAFENTHKGQEVLGSVEAKGGAIDIQEGVLPLEVIYLLAVCHKRLNVPSLHCSLLCLSPLS